MTNLGQCKCGQVQYRFDGEIRTVLNCHCNMCRQMNGTAYSSYVVIPLATLSVVRGEGKLSVYRVTEGALKHFCSNCGTPLFNSNPIRYPGLAMLYLGSLSDGKAFTPLINIYSESKLPWVDSLAGLRSFEQGPQKRT